MLDADAAVSVALDCCRFAGELRTESDGWVVELANFSGDAVAAVTALRAALQDFGANHDINRCRWFVHTAHCAVPNQALIRSLESLGFECASNRGLNKIYERVDSLAPAVAKRCSDATVLNKSTRHEPC